MGPNPCDRGLCRFTPSFEQLFAHVRSTSRTIAGDAVNAETRKLLTRAGFLGPARKRQSLLLRECAGDGGRSVVPTRQQWLFDRNGHQRRGGQEETGPPQRRSNVRAVRGLAPDSRGLCRCPALRQEPYQAIGNFLRIQELPSAPRQSSDHRRQRSRGSGFRQTREARGLLPRIYVQSRQRRNDAERHTILLLANRGEEKFVKLRMNERKRGA
jgi:hypothetical protein